MKKANTIKQCLSFMVRVFCHNSILNLIYTRPWDVHSYKAKLTILDSRIGFRITMSWTEN